MRPLTATQVLGAFPRHERRSVRPPPTPLWADLDFLAWTHRSGHLGFLVCEQDGDTVGLALERRVVSTQGARRFMCDLCCTLHGQGGVATFTRWNHGRTTARAVMLCADLGCGAWVRGLRKNDCVQMAETLSPAEKVARMMANLRHLIGVLESDRSLDV